MLGSSAFGQFKEGGETSGVILGESQVQQWQFGLEVTAAEGPCANIVGYVPLPTEWPEQQVTVVKEDISPAAKVTYETADGGVRLMLVRIASLPAGQTCKALVTMEIRKNTQLTPEDTSVYTIAPAKKLPKEVKPHLLPSPLIESKSPKLKSTMRGIVADKKTAWDKIEAIYDWTRKTVKHQKGPTKGAMSTLRDETGNSEDMAELFIALCRAADVPARTVWVTGHCHPEFYLVDESGKGYWFPCETHGDRSFGGIREIRPILEKGDCFRPPYDRKERQRFLKEYLTASGVSKPKAHFVRTAVGGQ
jgi:hypothetical protein